MENPDVSLQTDAALKQGPTDPKYQSKKEQPKIAVTTDKEEKNVGYTEDDLNKCRVEGEDFSGLFLNHLLYAQPQDVTVCWKTKNHVDGK
ncbi:hypothetical protein ROHU_015013 [Labeo rohita]|uniref:Uncharacterized protein n=1 Tax=Labeo rohita TaxID=84645 RepID=A0A498NQF6_LABRO|nr:hypothetical protein ROHU_015013 [Labeo rohita]